MIELLLTLLAMLLLLLLEGFFSGAEIALVNADKLKLRQRAKKGETGARLMLELFKQPERLLGTTLLGTNIAMVTFTTLGTVTLVRWFGDLGELLALLILTPLVLLLGEVVPKSVYQQKADILAPIVIRPLRWFSWLLFPVVFVFAGFARLATRLFGRKVPRNLFVAREKMRLLLESADQAPSDEIIDRERIRRAMRFGDLTAQEAMIPLHELVTLHTRQSVARAIHLVHGTGFNRLPVYQADASQIVGVVVLSTWDLLDPELAKRSLSELTRPVHYVSANQPIAQLATELQNRDDHLAIVVDEFGSAVGMVTLEDIFEQVVGEIEDVDFRIHPPRHPGYEVVEPGAILADAKLPISELSDLLGLEFGSVTFYTVGGLLTTHLQHVPRKDDTIEAYGYRFTVTAADDRAALKVLVTRAGAPARH
jgi:CBS domain containing-hemolysin-like protein